MQADEVWPLDAVGQPMQFIAQFNLLQAPWLPKVLQGNALLQFFVGEKWDEKEVALYGKPAIFGRLPHGKTNPKVQFPVQKVQNKC